MDTLWTDIRYAIRMQLKQPGFTAVAVITLALGIGANTAIFSVVNAVLLRPLPFPDSGRLVLVWATQEADGNKQDVASYPDFEEWKAQSKSFDSLAAFTTRSVTLAGGEFAELVPGLQTTPGFFEMLGVAPAKGRTFRPDEGETGAAHVALLSDALWKGRFASRPDILGQTVRVNEETYTIIGVMLPGFKFSPGTPEQIYTPLVRDPDRNHGFLRVVGRLRPQIAMAMAQAEMDTIARRLTEQFPKSNKGVGVNLVSLADALVGQVRTGLLIFLGVVGLVLLIACTNVANLMLARSASRQKELAVRAALGAGRARLIQQLLTESTVLALAGGALGLLLSSWTAQLLVALLTKNFQVPRLESTSTDGWVLGFTLLVSLATGILFGVVPAFAAASPDMHEGLRESGRSATSGMRGRRIRGALVITETALALVLLAGAGLLLKSLLVMRSTAPGFQTKNLLAVEFWLPRVKFASPAERAQFFENALARTEAVPGVRSAALVANLPLGGGSDSLGFHIVGRPDPAPGKYFSARFNIVSRGYFRTMAIPVRAGREFNEQDVANSPGVIVINETAARQFWPAEDATGKQIVLPVTKDTSVTLSVVGVTGDVRQSELGSSPRPEIFLNYGQPGPPWPWLVMVVRTVAEPSALAGTIKSVAQSVDRDVPVSQMSTMDEVLSISLAQPRVYTLLLGVFASLALALAAVGLYGVVSYTVTQRTHELGIRMALGARHVDILRLVLQQGLRLSIAGIAVGMLCALAVTRLLTNLVPSVQPGDPLTFAGVGVLLAGVSLAACYIPARRATKVDPMVALRYE